jgi:hypothetical protein
MRVKDHGRASLHMVSQNQYSPFPVASKLLSSTAGEISVFIP